MNMNDWFRILCDKSRNRLMLWCSLTQVMRLSENTQKHIFVIALSSEFYALVNGTSAGFRAVSMLKDLGVDISKNTQIDRQHWK